MAFQKAVKFDAKARVAIAGPSGSGKTFTALTLAFGLADGGGVALIDTERGSASKYADQFPEFDVMELTSFHPQKFINGMQEAEQAGYAVLVIDSLSHAWNGTGGLLEIVEGITKRSKSANSFTAWSEATPIQNKLIEAIVGSKMHIICTMRSKQEYVLEANSNGRQTPRKVGMAPIQRADMEYEFDCFFEMDHDNTLLVQKTRCSALTGAVIPKPDAQVAEVLKTWLRGEKPAQVRVSPTSETSSVSDEAAKTRLRTTYQHCLKAGACRSYEEFYAFASVSLGGDPIGAGNVLTLSEGQLKFLRDLADAEKPEPVASTATA